MVLPKIGVNMTEAVIAKWLVRVGDKVEEGEAIAEAETDKSVQEIYSTDSGIVAQFLFSEGETVQCYQDMLIFVDEGETFAGDTPVSQNETKASVPPAETAEPETAPAVSSKSALSAVDRVRISPLAKKMAAELGIDPARVRPGTPGGRIVKADILAFRSADFRSVPPDAPEVAEIVEKIPMTPVRKAIAAKMTESHREKPCASLSITVQANAILALRAKYRERGIAVSMDAIFARIAGSALSRHRGVIAVLEGDAILVKRDIHVGVAVDTPKGLMVPVIRDADKKSLAEIGEDLAKKAGQAKEGRIAAESISGGTFTITNLGMFDVERFTPIVNSPECCILAVGAIRKTFIPDEDDQPVLTKVFEMTLVFDHRIIDGVPAARFLKDFKDFAENPELLL